MPQTLNVLGKQGTAKISKVDSEEVSRSLSEAAKVVWPADLDERRG